MEIIRWKRFISKDLWSRSKEKNNYACFSLKHTPCFPISPPPLPDAEPSSRSLMCCSWHQTSRSWPGFKPDLYRPADHCQSSLPPKKTPSDIGELPVGEPQICSAPQTRSSASFTLWWPQMETEGFQYQQIKLQFSQSKVTLPAWNLDQLRSVFPRSSQSSSLPSRTFFADQ